MSHKNWRVGLVALLITLVPTAKAFAESCIQNYHYQLEQFNHVKWKAAGLGGVGAVATVGGVVLSATLPMVGVPVAAAGVMSLKNGYALKVQKDQAKSFMDVLGVYEGAKQWLLKKETTEPLQDFADDVSADENDLTWVSQLIVDWMESGIICSDGHLSNIAEIQTAVQTMVLQQPHPKN